MPKLLLMQGLPASGKSTRAKALLREYGNAVRLNRDLLRTMLHDDVWSMKKEAITVGAMRTLAQGLFCQSEIGVVIIDDTNLNPRVVAQWKGAAHDFGVGYEVERLETPFAECVERDAKRPNAVGRHVIVGMAMQYGLYPQPKKGMVICDIDGTLADCAHRLHHLKGDTKNWQGFFDAMRDDTPRDEVIAKIEQYQAEGYEIFLMSGRPDSHRAHTIGWLLHRCPGIVYEALFMRQTGDHRPDTEMKQDLLRRYFPDLSWIHAVVDDRKSILEMWRTNLPHAEVINVGGENNDF